MAAETPDACRGAEQSRVRLPGPGGAVEGAPRCSRRSAGERREAEAWKTWAGGASRAGHGG